MDPGIESLGLIDDGKVEWFLGRPVWVHSDESNWYDIGFW
jgi:hypothetical protein